MTERRKYFPRGPHVGQSWIRHAFCNALIKYRGGMYDQQDATISQYLLEV
jgi:hypothetical protein